MKSELDALIAKYEHLKSGSQAGSTVSKVALIVIEEALKDLKALRDKCDNTKTKPAMSVYP